MPNEEAADSWYDWTKQWVVVFFTPKRGEFFKVCKILYDPRIRFTGSSPNEWASFQKEVNCLDRISPKEDAFYRILVRTEEVEKAMELIEGYLRGK